MVEHADLGETKGMSYARQLLDSYPGTAMADAGVLTATIDALNDSAQACTACADGDLAEHNVADLLTCIRLCLDCADVCYRHRSRHQPPDKRWRPVREALAGGLGGDLEELRSRMRQACSDARAPPDMRRGLPSVRAGLPGTSREVTSTPFQQAPHVGGWSDGRGFAVSALAATAQALLDLQGEAIHPDVGEWPGSVQPLLPPAMP